MVIRNNKGSVITSCSKKFPHAYSGSDIEAMTAAMTLPFALDIGITHAVLEGDSWAVIRALMEDDCSLAPFGLLVVSQHFDQLLYSYTKRESNLVAYSLAKYVIGIPDFLVYMNDVPSHFHYVFQANLVGLH